MSVPGSHRLDLGHVLQTLAEPRNCSNWCEGGPMRLSAVGWGPLDKVRCGSQRAVREHCGTSAHQLRAALPYAPS